MTREMTKIMMNSDPTFNERIEDIHDLTYLRKYACPRVAHKNNWYMECIDCKKCKTGKQVALIMEKETAPELKQEKETDPARQHIVDIFSMDEPLKVLLKENFTMRPPSLYAKVNAWRRKYPDLEEKYKMVEKVRFLWTKKYESMKIPDIFKELYPSAEEVKGMQEDDSISIESFLKENEKPVIAETMNIPDMKQTKKVSEIDILLSKLNSQKAEYENKLKEVEKQIEAVKTVQKLMSALS